MRLARVVCVVLSGLAGLLVAPAASAAPGTVKVLSWNVCGNAPSTTDCTQAGYTGKIAANVSASIDRHPGLDAVLLQEVCAADVSRLGALRPGWRFQFTPVWYGRTGDRHRVACRDDRSTGKSRGYFGIAVGVRSTHVSFRHWYYSAAPTWNGWHKYRVTQPLLCADAADLDTTFCGTHLTPIPAQLGSGSGRHDTTPAERKVYWRIQDQQARGILQRVGTRGRVVAGGDLNVAPPDSTAGAAIDPNATVPLYSGYQECDRSAHGGKRTGAGTYQWHGGTGRTKFDYVFGSKSATMSCYVTDAHVYTSDHRSITATITF